jgi:hypothetical protein
MPQSTNIAPKGVTSKIENPTSPLARATPSTRRLVEVPIKVKVPPKIAA